MPYEKLKTFISKHKNYFGKNIDSALKVIENTEKNKSTTKPINILNQLEDLRQYRTKEIEKQKRKLLIQTTAESRVPLKN